MVWDPYQNLLQPLLFEGLKADPETVSRQLLATLAWIDRQQGWLDPVRDQLHKTCVYADPRLEIQVAGIPFANPVGLAAGFDKDGIAAGMWPDLGFGFAELGSVTALAQPGNPRPRLFRLRQDDAALNRMGFNNQGSAALSTHLEELSQRQPRRIPIGINLGKSKLTALPDAPADYLTSFRQLKDWADYFVVNVSSPNTPGLRDLQTSDNLSGILTALQQDNTTGIPIWVKIAPDLEWGQLDDIIAVAQTFSLAGLIATNTTLSRQGLKTQLVNGQSVDEQAGGISGAPLRQRSTEVIRYLYAQTQGSLPIIGVGGIFSATDAWEKITAGASLVQVYTGWIYEGPLMVKRILKGLIAQLETYGLTQIQDAVGLDQLKTPKIKDKGNPPFGY
ncbi:MAG: quinone-dependent dihydroorotate dehydrogenase [Synechococcaceae cyanobacterium SM2_3_2]|nr:quinone-dependent dihydroorotate dehydrogenase [Synechococcaceae cyanobacterium SM2_3_2]